ncbi:hypothetical protein D3C76_1309710 [compost metagenome]
MSRFSCTLPAGPCRLSLRALSSRARSKDSCSPFTVSSLAFICSALNRAGSSVASLPSCRRGGCSLRPLMVPWKLSASDARPLSSSLVSWPPCTSALTARPCSPLARDRVTVAPEAVVRLRFTALAGCWRRLLPWILSVSALGCAPSAKANTDCVNDWPPLATN